MKNLFYFLAQMPFEQQPIGVKIFVTLIGLSLLSGAVVFLGWRFLKEREKWIEEKRSYIEGVLSKSEIKNYISTLISKSTLDMPFFVVQVDIDKFSQIENAFGDKVATDVITQLATRYIKLLPLQVHLGRTEADTFVICFKNEYEYDEVYHIAQKIHDIFAEPIRISYDVEISCTASIAICQYPRHGENVNQLLESLSIANYTAKRVGGDKIVVYSESMGSSEGENIQYYEQVKEAIRNKEFVLYYQPIVDGVNNTVWGAEALLRWEHSKLGLINPKEFLSILEQSGDIYWIGIWSLEEMLKKQIEIKNRFNPKDFKISINLSMKQLANEHLCVDFLKVLKKYKMLAKDIVIELEEFIMYDQQETIHDNILKLRDTGFQIAVDGYAFDHNSLMKLDKLPIDIIKLNSNFLMDENIEIMKRITEMIAEFAHNKGVTIVAERIENLQMVEYFKEQNINLIQGYFVSKPINGDSFTNFYANSKTYITKLFNPSNEEEIKPEDLNPTLDAASAEEEVEEKEEVSTEEVAKESVKEDAIAEEAKETEETKEETQAEETKVEEAPAEEEQVEQVEEVPAEETPAEEVVSEAQEEQVETSEEASPTEETAEEPKEEVKENTENNEENSTDTTEPSVSEGSNSEAEISSVDGQNDPESQEN